MRKDHKPHPQFPWLHVSSDGEIVSHKTSNSPDKAPRVLRKTPNHRGYLYVSAWDRKCVKRLSVARAVLDAHVGPSPSAQSSHLNGNKLDNRLENLAWETPKQNCARRIQHGNTPKGEKNGYAKLKEADVVEIRERRLRGEMIKDIAKSYPVSRSAISLICSGKNWKSIGIARPKGDKP